METEDIPSTFLDMEDAGTSKTSQCDNTGKLLECNASESLSCATPNPFNPAATALMTSSARSMEYRSTSTNFMKKRTRQAAPEKQSRIDDPFASLSIPQLAEALHKMSQSMEMMSHEMALMRLEINNGNRERCCCNASPNTESVDLAVGTKSQQPLGKKAYAKYYPDFKDRESTPSTKKSSVQFAPTYLEVANQGNGRPVAVRASKPPAGMKKIMGHKKDTIVISTQVYSEEANRNMEISCIDELLAKTMTLPPPRMPQDIKATVFRINRVKPYREVASKEWRRILTSRNIKVFSLLRPHQTDIEVLVQEEDAQKMRDFILEIKRIPADPDPFLRRDGQQGPLTQEMLTVTLQQRLRMLRYETSGVGMRYLEKIVLDGIKKLSKESMRSQMQKELQELLTTRRWPLLSSLENHDTSSSELVL